MKRRFDWIAEAVSGRPSPEAVMHMCRAMQTWWSADGSLPLERCLGLPTTPARVRLALRDQYLRRAAALLPGAGPWATAERLHQEAARFMGRRWPCWCDFPQAPQRATEIERLLWRAAKAGGGRLPGTARRFAQILAD